LIPIGVRVERVRTAADLIPVYKSISICIRSERVGASLEHFLAVHKPIAIRIDIGWIGPNLRLTLVGQAIPIGILLPRSGCGRLVGNDGLGHTSRYCRTSNDRLSRAGSQRRPCGSGPVRAGILESAAKKKEAGRE
jgi:hypothetical protein